MSTIKTVAALPTLMTHDEREEYDKFARDKNVGFTPTPGDSMTIVGTDLVLWVRVNTAGIANWQVIAMNSDGDVLATLAILSSPPHGGDLLPLIDLARRAFPNHAELQDVNDRD